MQRHLEL